MVGTVLRFFSAPHKREEVIQTLHSLVGHTRAMSGCLGCWASIDLENTNAFVYAEQWASQADLNRHMQSQEFKKILGLMEMSEHEPLIRFATIPETHGMELIEQVRRER